jgi:hypothetical protein
MCPHISTNINIGIGIDLVAIRAIASYFQLHVWMISGLDTNFFPNTCYGNTL